MGSLHGIGLRVQTHRVSWRQGALWGLSDVSLLKAGGRCRAAPMARRWHMDGTERSIPPVDSR